MIRNIFRATLPEKPGAYRRCGAGVVRLSVAALLIAVNVTAAGCQANLEELVYTMSGKIDGSRIARASSPVSKSAPEPAPRPADREALVPRLPKTVRIPPTPTVKETPPTNPASLMGMTRNKVEALLGKPGFTRRDPPGELWRFRGEDCVLDMYFYFRKGRMVLDYMEARKGMVREADNSDCLNRLIRATRRQPGTG